MVVSNTNSKILLTFVDELRNLLFILICSIVMFSCTKEKDVPFQDSIKDTIEVVFYHDISGNYSGTIQDIRFINSNVYEILDSAKHSITVSELNFSTVFIENISNKIQSNAEASLFRVNRTGGYLSFIPHTMADSTGPDSVFKSTYNGIYYYANGNLDYFFFYIKNNDTTHQLFSGKLK